ECLFGSPLHSHVHPKGSHRAWISAGTVGFTHAADIRCLLIDQVHVGYSGSHIFCSDISAVQAVYVPSESSEECFVFSFFGITAHNVPASSEIKSCRHILTCHAARQPQHVFDCFFLSFIIPHSAAAESRSECRIVYTDNRFQPACLIVTENQLFVILFHHFFKYHY